MIIPNYRCPVYLFIEGVKMNNTTKTLLVAILFIMIAVSSVYLTDTDDSSAETITLTTEDGLTFQLTSADGVCTAKLTAIDPSIKDLVVPGTVKDSDGKEYTVTASGRLYVTNSALTTAVFPESLVSVDRDLFRELSKLTYAELPGVTALPENCFSSCSALKEVILSDDITKIGAFAFNDCSSLTNLVIGDNVASVGKAAFQNCSSLQSLTIVGKISEIGESIFLSCVKLTDLDIDLTGVTDSTVSASSLFGSRNSVQTTSAIFTNGGATLIHLPLVEDYAIPDGVTDVNSCAAYGNNVLVNLKVPKSVTSIGSYAFANCTALKSVVFEAGSDVYLDSYVFQNDGSVTEFKAPDNVGWVGTGAFNGFGALVVMNIDGSKTLVAVPADASAEDIPTDITVIGGYAMSGWQGEGYTVPDTVTSIGDYAFSKSKIKAITLNEGLKTIGNSAFESAGSLNGIVLPSTVETIGNYCFSSSGLKTVTLNDGLLSIGTNAFAFSGSLTSITIPDSVTSLGERSFYSCRSLSSAVLGDGITTLGNYMFMACMTLKTVKLPSGLTSIGDFAFMACMSLKELSIPSTVATIGNNAFGNCRGLTSLSLPDGLQSVGNNAFNSVGLVLTANLKGVRAIIHVPTNAKVEDLPEDIVAIGSYAFLNWTGTSYAIPSTVKTIGDYAFSGCRSLVDLTIPTSVTSVGNYAFRNCSSLTEVALPKSMASISEHLFDGCSSLKTIELPGDLKTIGDSAFYGCSSLTSVTLPSTLRTINENAFNGCSSLSSVILPENLDYIGVRAFRDCSSLKEITIPGKVRSISESAFTFAGLESVTVNEGVTEIGRSAFSYCKSLKNVSLPSTLSVIQTRAFYSCGIEKITLPVNLINGGSLLFYECASLKEITLNGYITDSFGNGSAPTTIEVVSGSPEINVSALTSLKIHEGVVLQALTASSDITLKDDIGTYVKTTLVKSDGTETEGKYYTALNSGSIVLPSDCVGVLPGIMISAMESGRASVSTDNTYISIDGNCLYFGTVLAGMVATDKAVVIREGTTSIAANALKGKTTLTSNGTSSSSPYILLPSTLTSVQYQGIVPDDSPILLKNAIPINSSCVVGKVYIQVGSEVSGSSVYDGYWYGSDGTYTVFAINDLIHASLKNTSSADGKVSFALSVDPAYSKSDISVTVLDRDNPVTVKAVNGVYTVTAGSKVSVTGVSASIFNVSVNSGDHIAVSLLSSSYTYGEEAVLTVSPETSYSLSDISVSVNGAQITVSDDGTYRFAVTSDVIVTVSAVATATDYSTVTFDTDGGSTVESVKVITGSRLVLPDAPTKDGYLFFAWYLDKAYTQAASDGTVISTDATLYAKWVSASTAQYTLTLEVDSGILSAVYDGGAIANGGRIYAGTAVTVTYSGGHNHHVSVWYIDGKASTVKGDSITVTVNADTSVKAEADYYFADISDLISESKGISSTDSYALAWSFSGARGYLIVDNYAYISTKSGLFCKVDLDTGRTVKSYSTGVDSGKDWPAAGNGLVLDPQSGLVFDLDLNPVYKLGVTAQNAFYDDGYWYINPSKTVYCYPAADGDTSASDNVQTVRWVADIYGYIDTLTLPTTLAFGKNFVTYMGTGGANSDANRYIYTIDKETGKQVDSYLMPEIYNSYWNYGYLYCSEGMITAKCQWLTLFAAASGYEQDKTIAYRVFVDDDGNIEDDSGLSINVGLISYGSSIVVYEGLGYMWTSGTFFVIDLHDGKVLARKDCGSANAVRTNLSLAVGEDGVVTGYVNPYPYDSTHGVYSFEYTVATNNLVTYEINAGGYYQYPDADFTKIGPNGQLVFMNDSKCVMCISTAVTVTIDYSDGTTEKRAVAVNSTLGDDPAVKAYYINVFTEYDTSTPITEDITLSASLNDWYLDGNTLHITKLFDMQAYSKSSKAPWADKEFRSVVFEDGVTKVGAYAFYACVDLMSVTFASSVASIGDCAFYGCVSLSEVIGLSDNAEVGTDAFAKTGIMNYVLYKVGCGKYAKIYYAYGSDIVAPEDPSKEGYTFGGWQGLPSKMSLSNISVRADFSVNEYTITFDTDGGSEVDSITLVYGAIIDAPKDPTKTGYVFAGWDSLPKTMPAENITVKALWTAEAHTVAVKYIFEDGTSAADTITVSVFYGEQYNVASPVLHGYYTETATVSGTMDVSDIEATVTYLKDTFEYELSGTVSESGANSILSIALKRSSGHSDITDARLLVIAMYEGGIAVNVCPSLVLSDGSGSKTVTVSSDRLVSVTVQVVSGFPLGAYDNYGSYLYDTAQVTVTVTSDANGSVSVTEPLKVSSGTAISADGSKLTVGGTVVTATPNEGYEFSSWVITDASGKVFERKTVDEPLTVTAKFEIIASTND